MIFQNAAFLLQNPVVLRQCRVNNSAGGRTAPDRRTAAAGSLPFSGSSDPPGRTAPWAVPQRSPRRFSSSPHSATAAGGGSRKTESIGCSAAAPERIQNRRFPEIFLKPHHFRGFLRPEAFPAAKIADGFQQVGFSLGVIPTIRLTPGSNCAAIS